MSRNVNDDLTVCKICGFTKNRKTVISWERNIFFFKLKNACITLMGYNMTKIRFLAEVTRKFLFKGILTLSFGFRSSFLNAKSLRKPSRFPWNNLRRASLCFKTLRTVTAIPVCNFTCSERSKLSLSMFLFFKQMSCTRDKVSLLSNTDENPISDKIWPGVSFFINSGMSSDWLAEREWENLVIKLEGRYLFLERWIYKNVFLQVLKLVFTTFS